ncbi:hypothetical protein Ancab_035922, partial [Ancistrocladus abbreviatus]
SSESAKQATKTSIKATAAGSNAEPQQAATAESLGNKGQTGENPKDHNRMNHLQHEPPSAPVLTKLTTPRIENQPRPS